MFMVVIAYPFHVYIAGKCIFLVAAWSFPLSPGYPYTLMEQKNLYAS